MDNVELAHSSMEHAHAHGHATDNSASTRWAAVLVAILAAVAVVLEMSANDAQTSFLSHHVSASDTWSQYQAKSVRRTVLQQAADGMEGQLGGQADAAIQARIARARSEAARMQSEPGHDGMEQLAGRAHEFEHTRDHELHLYENMERAVRGVQIAIVLLGLFMVTRMRWLLIGGGVIGVVAAAYAAAVGLALL